MAIICFATAWPCSYVRGLYSASRLLLSKHLLDYWSFHLEKCVIFFISRNATELAHTILLYMVMLWNLFTVSRRHYYVSVYLKSVYFKRHYFFCKHPGSCGSCESESKPRPFHLPLFSLSLQMKTFFVSHYVISSPVHLPMCQNGILEMFLMWRLQSQLGNMSGLA